MSKLVFAAAAAILSVSAAQAATQDSPAEATSEAEGQTSTNNIVCRRMPPPTGTRIGTRRICKTQNEWDAINREARNVVEEAFNRSKQQSGN